MHPTPPQTTVTKRGANHGLHLVLTLLTCGLWAVTGWPIAALMGRRTQVTSYPAAVPPPQGYYPPPGYQQAPPGAYGQPPQADQER